MDLCCIPIPSVKPNEETTLATATSTTKATTTLKATTSTKATSGQICITEGSPNPDQACVFPFQYDGRDYNECTSWNARYWCGLQYAYSSNGWGYCKESVCPPTAETEEAAMTTKKVTTAVSPEACRTIGTPNPDQPCVFPFNYGGRDYNECIDWNGRYWCGIQYEYGSKSWGYCLEEACPPTKVTEKGEEGLTTNSLFNSTGLPSTPRAVTTGMEETTMTTSIITTTAREVEKGYTNLTLRDGDLGYFCDIEFDFTLDKTFQLDSDLIISCKPSSDLSDSNSFLEEKKFKMKTSKNVDLDCSMNAIFSNEESGSIEVSDKAVKKSLSCNVPTEVCHTNNGSVYPAKCAPSFQYKGREYHGCTDKEMTQNDDRLWCGVEVDSNLNMIDGQWGYCSSACSFCSGSPVTRKEGRDLSAPCGYECLVNTRKLMKGSVGSKDIPLLNPHASIYGDEKNNFIKEVKGQIQLNIGEQIIILTCPLSKFIDPDLMGFQTVYAVCGPNQYRFTIYSLTGKLLHEAFANDRFGCDPCPKTYRYVPGYVSSTEDSHRGTSYDIPNVDVCEDRCYDTKSCKSFSYSKNDRECKIFSNIIEEPTYNFNYEDYVICTKDEGQEDFDIEDRSRDWRGYVETVRDLEQLIKDGKYQEQIKKYRNAAISLLEKSISLPKHLEKSMGSNTLLPFHNTILPNQVNDKKNSMIHDDKENYELFDCRQRNNLNEKVYYIPEDNRMRHVVNEIGYLMIQYGKINPSNDHANYMSRKLVRVDNFLYEMLLNKEGNLYDNPVACYYYINSPVPNKKLSKVQCEDIIAKYKDIKAINKDIKAVNKDGLGYDKYKANTEDDMIYNAMRNLFHAEHNSWTSTNVVNYYGENKDRNFKAFISEKFAFAIFCETVRNTEMLPVTLALLTLESQVIKQVELITLLLNFPTEIHPMTGPGTFYHNMREYELYTGGRMYAVGFFPIPYTLDELLMEDDWSWRNWLPKDKRNRKTAIKKEALKVHNKAATIFDLYEKEIARSILDVYFVTKLEEKENQIIVDLAFMDDDILMMSEYLFNTK